MWIGFVYFSFVIPGLTRDLLDAVAMFDEFPDQVWDDGWLGSLLLGMCDVLNPHLNPPPQAGEDFFG